MRSDTLPEADLHQDEILILCGALTSAELASALSLKVQVDTELL
jgi:hypothetical protein